jgi:hypothetical protein
MGALQANQADNRTWPCIQPRCMQSTQQLPLRCDKVRSPTVTVASARSRKMPTQLLCMQAEPGFGGCSGQVPGYLTHKG